MTDNLWGGSLEALRTSSANTRVAHYREQATALREMASHVTSTMATDLLELAGKYDALAESVSVA